MTHDWNLPTLIDHTVLRPDATKADVLRLCQEAREFGFVVIFVPPCYIDEAVEAVAGTNIRVGIPIGFPLGGHTTATKVAEAIEGVARGAKILDMVINVSRLKSGDYNLVRTDMAEVVKATAGAEHKVILGDLLSDARGKDHGLPAGRGSGDGLCEDFDGICRCRCHGGGCETDERRGGWSRQGESLRRNSRLEDHAGHAGGRGGSDRHQRKSCDHGRVECRKAEGVSHHDGGA